MVQSRSRAEDAALSASAASTGERGSRLMVKIALIAIASMTLAIVVGTMRKDISICTGRTEDWQRPVCMYDPFCVWGIFFV